MGKRRRVFRYDCAVVGGGPGGLVATLYLSRFRRKVVLIDSGHSRAQWIPRIRNLIGYSKGLTGPQLLAHLSDQVHQYQADWIQGEAQIFRRSEGFEVRVGKRRFSARKVILATGMKDHQPPLSNIPALRKKGVLAYCPICDGFDHQDQHIGLLVKDNHGLRKVKFLFQFTSRISIFQTRPFRVAPQHLRKIEEMRLTLHKGRIQSLRYRMRPRGLSVQMEDSPDRFSVDVAYVALGVDFNELSIRHLRGLRRTKEGFVLTKSHQETSIPGLYAVGDCVSALAQVSVAIGQAALAATRVHNELGFF